MIVSIIRHGQTDHNKQGVLQGQLDTPLNESGRSEAVKLGERLRNVTFTHVYASNLDRASETAKLILGQNRANPPSNKNIIFDARLKERKFGVYEGKPKEALATAHGDAKKGKLYPGRRDYAPESGESMSQVYDRARDFFFEMCLALQTEGHQGDSQMPQVMIATHGGVAIELFQMFVKELDCLPPEGKTQNQMIAIPGNTALSQFRIELNTIQSSLTNSCSFVAKDIVSRAECLMIHDRAHCSSENGTGTTTMY